MKGHWRHKGSFQGRKKNKPYRMQKYVKGQWKNMKFFTCPEKAFLAMVDYALDLGSFRVWDASRKAVLVWPDEDYRLELSPDQLRYRTRYGSMSSFDPKIWSDKVVQSYQKSVVLGSLGNSGV